MKRTTQSLNKRLAAKQAELEALQKEMELAKKREQSILKGAKTTVELYRYLGQNIRIAREAAGLTQAELAERVDLTRCSVVNIEGGTQRPPIHVLWLLCKVLKVDWKDTLPPIK